MTKRKKLDYLNNRSIDQIKIAQREALIKTLKIKKVPYRKITINNFTEENLGELISFFIFETILIGKVIKVNPFDQPGVEQVKVLTKKLLS